MKTVPHISYKKHVFVGVNNHNHENDSEPSHGEQIFLMLKSFLQTEGLATDILLTKTGCMGQCGSEGATIVIYPDMKWFLEVAHEDLDEIQGYIVK